MFTCLLTWIMGMFVIYLYELVREAVELLLKWQRMLFRQFIGSSNGVEIRFLGRSCNRNTLFSRKIVYVFCWTFSMDWLYEIECRTLLFL